MKRITLLDLTSGEAMPVCASAPLLSSAKHGWAHLSFEHHFTRPREIPRVALHDFGVCLELSSAASALGLRRLSTGQSRQSQFEICVVPPLAEIKPQFIDSHLEMLYLHLDPLFMRRIAAETAESDWREMRMKLTAFDPTLQHLLFALKHELAADCRNGSLFADSIAAAFAVHLLKNYSSAKIAPETGGLPPRVLRRVVEFINDNLTEDLILSDIAGVAGKSQYHLTRLFKQSTGTSITRYVQSQRVKLAQTLLANQNLSVTEISHRIGYTSHSRFSAVFRQLTGQTPSDYRKNL